MAYGPTCHANWRVAATAVLVLSAAPARPDASNGLPTQLRPSLPVFGSGPAVNFLDGNNQALTNAAAHTGFSLAIPLLGEHFWGRKGLWIAGLSWMALSVAQESLFHAPPKPGAGYPAEVRSDLLTRLVPCATLLVWDALRHRGQADMRPAIPPDLPGRPWPSGQDIPKPAGEAESKRELARASIDEAALRASGLLAEQADPPIEGSPQRSWQ